MTEAPSPPSPAPGPAKAEAPPERAPSPPATPAEPLDHVETWVFDLDNTLYPAACNLFSQVDQRMGEFICDLLDLPPHDARALQKQYFREHGTTLRGLMTVHGIDPAAFLDYVHDIDVTVVPVQPALDRALGRLGGRKVIFTNGSVAHAERVMDRLGITRHFDAIWDIVASDFVPKPDPGPYRRLIESHGLSPRATAMVEDMAKNLKPAHDLGMTTVWVRTDSDWALPADGDDHVHHVVDDLPGWLEAVAQARG